MHMHTYARVLMWLPTAPEHAAARALLVAASRSDMAEPLLVRGCEVRIHEGSLRVVLAAAAEGEGGVGGSVEKGKTAAAFGFQAPLLSERRFEEEDEGMEQGEEDA